MENRTEGLSTQEAVVFLGKKEIPEAIRTFLNNDSDDSYQFDDKVALSRHNFKFIATNSEDKELPFGGYTAEQLAEYIVQQYLDTKNELKTVDLLVSNLSHEDADRFIQALYDKGFDNLEVRFLSNVDVKIENTSLHVKNNLNGITKISNKDPGYINLNQMFQSSPYVIKIQTKNLGINLNFDKDIQAFLCNKKESRTFFPNYLLNYVDQQYRQASIELKQAKAKSTELIAKIADRKSKDASQSDTWDKVDIFLKSKNLSDLNDRFKQLETNKGEFSSQRPFNPVKELTTDEQGFYDPKEARQQWLQEKESDVYTEIQNNYYALNKAYSELENLRNTLLAYSERYVHENQTSSKHQAKVAVMKATAAYLRNPSTETYQRIQDAKKQSGWDAGTFSKRVKTLSETVEAHQEELASLGMKKLK